MNQVYSLLPVRKAYGIYVRKYGEHESMTTNTKSVERVLRMKAEQERAGLIYTERMVSLTALCKCYEQIHNKQFVNKLVHVFLAAFLEMD